ncbi:MAG: alanine--tRNA ligase [Ignavibacteriaceae bacterium]
MTSKEIRNQFLEFFRSKDHKIVNSAPVVPFDDPTLLFTNAGMNQFKDVFIGAGKRDYKRAANTQKCIRVSGKHNDLEEVGYDTYHHTFFEMLGNWSFGDYYKKEAIKWAWELLTRVWKLPKQRLWATVYLTDDEAFDLWKSETDINPSHILRFDEKDNFWEMGETGPCGPCSEIHINLGEDYDNPEWVNAGTQVCIELWNLVFIQYNRDTNGTLHELPEKHIDTGMGFERICAVLQNKNSNYDTDIFYSIINAIESLSGKKYKSNENQIPMRVIADHIRALTVAIGDGAMPGNEGRGYVLRRILRRAARYGRKINLTEPFLFKLVKNVVDNLGDIFQELIQKKNFIEKVIRTEEENFNTTLDRGIELFNETLSAAIVKLFKEKYGQSYLIDANKDLSQNDYLITVGQITNDNIVSKIKIYLSQWNEETSKQFFPDQKRQINGSAVFKLYDTYGFPVDLTNVMAKEKGFSIDEEEFNRLMNQQKKRARDATKDKLASVNINTSDLDFTDIQKNKSEFTGYDELKSQAKVTAYKRNKDLDLIILDKTPFYVESGGQIDDIGRILLADSAIEVVDVTKKDDLIIHIAENSPVVLNPGTEVLAEVDVKRRAEIMRNHTATHFLHAALRKILGSHVQQAGSYVGPDRLRFDFTHFKKLSDEELRNIETLVNEELRNNYQLIHHRNIPFDEARKMGALMFFGDKYGDRVNVVQYGEFTKEFCGGTHVRFSAEVGLFKIISESSIASGIRRIEAVTGSAVEEFIYNQLSLIRQSDEKILQLNEEKKKLEKELSAVRMKNKLGDINKILSSPSIINGVNFYKLHTDVENMDELKALGDELRNRMKSGIGLLISSIEGKASIVCVVSDDLIKEKKLNAGKIVGKAAKLIGGGGGGKAHLATAGGKDVSAIPILLKQADQIIKEFID